MQNYLVNENDDPDDARQKIHDSLRGFVEKICETASKDKTMNSGFIDALTSLIFEFTDKIVTRDLLEFSKHAGRKNMINEEDVILLARKTSFHDHLYEYLQENIGVTPKGSKKSKKQ